MNLPHNKKNKGFSLIELIISMTVTLTLLVIVSTLLSGALGTRRRESRRNDAMVSAQAAINLMSREIANSGYGLTTNGIITADSNAQRIHFRANIENSNQQTNSIGEDLAYYFDVDTESIMRYDRYETPQMSVVVNRPGELTFQYFEYVSGSTPIAQTAPTNTTGRVRINIIVRLEPVEGQPNGETVALTSDVMIKNSKYMLNQY